MAPKDRLMELQKSQKGQVRVGEVMIPMVRQDAIDKFLEKVENVSQSIDLVESKITAIKTIHDSILSSTFDSQPEKEEQARVMKQITQISTNIRNEMKVLQTEVDRPGLLLLDYRIRKTQHNSLARRLVAIMADYNSEVAQYRKKCKDRIKRQFLIADTDGKPRTDEEIEEMIDTDKPLTLFSEGILADSQKAKDALADIEARHQDILALERNIIEIKELFFEVANLIESQNPTIDRLENNINMALDKVTDAKGQTAGALSKQRKARRMRNICLVVLFVVLVIVAISIAGYFGGS